MSDGAMVKQRLPSPPASLSGDYQQGMDQLIQHNAATPYSSELYPQEVDGYMQSRESTTYGSPVGDHWLADQHTPDQQLVLYHYHGDENNGTGYELYDSPLDAQSQTGPYHATHNVLKYPNQRYGASSPPTPTASEFSNGDFRTTRSGRSQVPNNSAQLIKVVGQNKSRSTGSVKPKKSTKQTKGDKPKIPKLDAPLSELTKDYNHILVRNMGEWVNRSAEVRSKEVEKRNGYVTRPMNSFMLYRSAYAERTKLWCLQNNHQVVSSVSGESWPMEPAEVREQYNEYARIERDNHQKAHPGYKFCPSKAQSSARKRKGTRDDSDEDERSEAGDADVEWRPSGDRKARTKSSKRLGREAGYPANSTLHGGLDAGLGGGLEFDPYAMGPAYNRSSYQATNPGRPLPAPLNEFELYGQYYQTTVQRSIAGPNVEDVRIRKTQVPGMPPEGTLSLIGLPGAHHYELFNQDSFGGSFDIGEPRVDPNLLGYDGDYIQQPNSFITEGQFQGLHDEEESMFRTTPRAYEPRAVTDVYQDTNTWGLEGARSKDADDAFARWMEQSNDR